MNDAVSNTSDRALLNGRLMYLQMVVRKLMEKAHISQEELDVENPYQEGTEEWWSFEIAAGEADMRAGRGIELRTAEDIDRYFDSL